MDFFWDLHQSYRIFEAERKADRARELSRDVRLDIDELSRRNEALTLACQALWELLREHSNLSDELLASKIRDIDLRDGKLDGKFTNEQESIRCPSCHRETSTRRKACLYCGTALPPDQIFKQY